MMSLFSSFDLGIYSMSSFSFFPILVLIGTSIFPISLFSMSLYLVFKNFYEFVCSLKPKDMGKSIFLFLISLTFLVFLLNFFSVFSYIFPFTSRISMVFMISLIFWISLMIFSLIRSLDHQLSHFIPEGTPLYLVWFLFLIELISSFIRPLTLTVRLFANIFSGHLLMILLSKLVFLFSPLVFLYLLLNMVEIFVAFIQSYIFSTMVMLYFAEVK